MPADRPAVPLHDEPSGPRLTILGSAGRLPGGALVVLALTVLVVSAVHGGVHEFLGALPTAVLLTLVAWLFFLGPHLRVGPEGLALVRGLSVTRLPWEGFVDAQAHWGLRITSADGSHLRWSGLGGSPHGPQNDLVDAAEAGTPVGGGGILSRRSHVEKMLRASRAGGATAQRAGERVRSRRSLPLTRWTDPQSRATERVTLTSSEAAVVLVTYAERRAAAQRGSTRPEAPSSGASDARPRRFLRRSPRLSAILALAAVLVAAAAPWLGPVLGRTSA